MALDRGKHGTFRSPAASQSASDPNWRNAGNLSPVGKAVRLPVKRQGAIIASIAILLGWCSPPAVAWFVSPIVVNSVDRGAGRPWPHILNEVGKDSPPLTNGDAAATVTWVGVTLRIQAPSENSCPHNVLRRPLLASRCSVRDESIATLTSAASSAAINQVIDTGFYARAALTATEPDNRTASAFGCRLDCCQCSESLAGDVASPRSVGVSTSHPCSVFTNQATAAPRVARSESICQNADFGAATTSALPSYCASGVTGTDAANFVDNGEAAECHSDEVVDARHSGILAYSALICFPLVPIEVAL